MQSCNAFPFPIFWQVVDGVHTPSIRFDEISSMINQKKVIAHDEVESRQGIE